MNYFLHNSDLTINLADNKVVFHNSTNEKIEGTLLETGISTKTAGKLKQEQPYIGNEDLMLTYGD